MPTNRDRPMPDTMVIQEARPSRCFYLYCVIPGNGRRRYGKIGIGGPEDDVYIIEHKDIAVVVSNPVNHSFERSEENILAHQRVVQRVFDEQLGLPLKFSTTENTEIDVQQLLEEHYAEFKEKLAKLGSFSEDVMEPGGSENGARELIDEVLAQSAASALRIRQLSEEVSRLTSTRYQKKMETLDSLSQTVETLQEKVGLIQDNLYRNKIERNLGGSDLSELPSCDAEIRVLREQLERLNRRALEETLGLHAKIGS